MPRILALITLLANTGVRTFDGFLQLKISTCEESSLPMKHAKNYRINIFDYEEKQDRVAVFYSIKTKQKTYSTFCNRNIFNPV